MNEKFIQTLSLLKKVASANQLYVWLVILSLALGIFSSLHRDLFDSRKAIESLREDSRLFEKISSEELMQKMGKNNIFFWAFRLTFLSGFALFLLGVYISVLFFRDLAKGRILLFSRDFTLVHWEISDILRALVVILFFVNFLHLAEPLFLEAFNLTPPNLSARFIGQAFLIHTFSLAVILYFVLKKYASQLSALGIKFTNLRDNIFMGIVHYIGLIPLLFASIFLSLLVAQSFRYEPPPSPISFFFFQSQPRFLLFLTVFFITLFGPFTEEIFFRGFCYPALRKKIGPLKAAGLVSLIFAWLHMNIIGFLPIFILGLVLVYLYEKTHSLTASIAVHVIHNSLILYLVFLYRSLLLR